jgi:hypothetical protein
MHDAERKHVLERIEVIEADPDYHREIPEIANPIKLPISLTDDPIAQEPCPVVIDLR